MGINPAEQLKLHQQEKQLSNLTRKWQNPHMFSNCSENCLGNDLMVTVFVFLSSIPWFAIPHSAHGMHGYNYGRHLLIDWLLRTWVSTMGHSQICWWIIIFRVNMAVNRGLVLYYTNYFQTHPIIVNSTHSYRKKITKNIFNYPITSWKLWFSITILVCWRVSTDGNYPPAVLVHHLRVANVLRGLADTTYPNTKKADLGM